MISVLKIYIFFLLFFIPFCIIINKLVTHLVMFESSKTVPEMVVHTFNPCTWEVETGKLRVW
jgi:hypothetical protein